MPASVITLQKLVLVSLTLEQVGHESVRRPSIDLVAQCSLTHRRDVT